MNMNKSCIVITHKDTVRKKVAPQQMVAFDDDTKLPEEVRKKAEEFLGQASQKAQQIIENAYADAEEIKEAARQEGLRQGNAEAQDKLSAQTQKAQDALKKLDAYRQSLFEALEMHVLDLSLDIAQKIINIKLQNDDTTYKELVKKAVDSLKIADHFTLTVSRDEYERFFKDSTDWLRAEIGCGAYDVAVDHKMPGGTCVVESDNQLVDAGVQTQLDKIRQHLAEQVG